MEEVLESYVRGRHASNENMILVKDENGDQIAIRNLNTRIDSTTTELKFMSVCEGTACLRFEDKKRSDFWIEFNLDVPILERLLSLAKSDFRSGE